MEEIVRMQDNLLLIRRTVGWTAEEFGEKIGVTRQTINNIESGRNNVTVDNLYKLHEILECPMSSFFVDIDGKEEAKDTKDVFSLEDLTQALILLKKQ